MTEDEARKKWCPMIRHESSLPMCKASDCMMWRSSETEANRLRADDEYRRTGKFTPTSDGYCGLAGKP